MLNPGETSLIGSWLEQGSGLVVDEACQRIEALTSGYLVHLAKASDGWSELYRDPADSRLWEKLYPQGHVHGGGPPSLQCISSKAALAKFGVKV